LYYTLVLNGEKNQTTAFSLALRNIQTDGIYIVIGNPSLNGFANGSVNIFYTPEPKDRNITFQSLTFGGNQSYYGYSLSISSDAKRILIGSPGKIYKNAYPKEIPQGFVSVLEKNSSTLWAEVFLFKGSDYLFFNFFGISVALSSGSNQNVLAIGSITYQYQMRSFIFTKNNSDWSLYKTYQTDRSLQFDETFWNKGLTFISGRNYSLALNDDTLLIGITYFSDYDVMECIGGTFFASATSVPLAASTIAAIIALILVTISIIFGTIFGFIQKKEKRDKAYTPIDDPLKS